MKSLRQLPFCNALRQSQPSTQPTCPRRLWTALTSSSTYNLPNRLGTSVWEWDPRVSDNMFSQAPSSPTFYFIYKWTNNLWLQCWIQRMGCELGIYIRSGCGTPQQTIMQTGNKGSGLCRGFCFVLVFVSYYIQGLIINSVGPSHNVCTIQSQCDLVIICPPSTVGGKRPLTIHFKWGSLLQWEFMK